MLHENREKFFYCAFLFVITCSQAACSQPVNTSRGATKPLVISNVQVYDKTLRQNPNKKLVLLTAYINELSIDLKYATYNNFTHHILYRNPKAYARLPVALALQKVQSELSEKGLGLKVFDAYRPYSVTEEMWKVVPDERYAANPAKGSGHNRGIAVDITLINLATKEELPMPTVFDDFTEKAHHNYMNLPENVLQNRALLKTTMEKYGFEALTTEWWHYSLANTSSTNELLDLSFNQLEKQGEDDKQ